MKIIVKSQPYNILSFDDSPERSCFSLTAHFVSFHFFLSIFSPSHGSFLSSPSLAHVLLPPVTSPHPPLQSTPIKALSTLSLSLMSAVKCNKSLTPYFSHYVSTYNNTCLSLHIYLISSIKCTHDFLRAV